MKLDIENVTSNNVCWLRDQGVKKNFEKLVIAVTFSP